jgi:DNA invertase Pin-like site-specific DNA recombinase
MSKTESKYDRRLRTRIDGWPTLDAQRAALVAAGAEKVFAEKVSGAVTDRKALARAIAALGPGDVLLVARAGQAC